MNEVQKEFTNPETVKVKAGDSFAIINKADFDEKKHELFSDKPKRQRRKKAE